ncbi:hypothetical protein NEMBOFW57_010183 [Staphylotrichum longicolle]|uniref:Uncharacterized protein n=1 Tax=Staphylotrichum longicolle TaxID=669026 RepID=A0AAD4EQF6_9PEZI|nr:hypothetical protein NEMBOFW57_010183 [Staphylotrichum longicolle]
MEENAAHPAEESEVVQQAPQIVQSPTRADASVVVETVGVDPEPTGEEVAESETASEAEDEEMHEAAEVRVEAAPESGLEGEAQPEVQPQPTATEVQSPRTKVEGVPPPQNDEQVNDEAEAAQSTPPQVTQSPWVKEANVVPGASGTPIPLPIPSAKLVVAREAPDEAVSQSPNVLPTTEATTHLQPPCDDDIDMCNSQLYPPHPSTPETKHSSLPTPDFTLSVKSFKDFMTPSPQKPAPKRRRISTSTSTGADDHLPSTQALLDAAISNPWTRPPTIKKPNKPKRSLKQQQQHEEQQPRPKKRVSWADAAADNAPSPLPSSTPTNTTTAITTTTTNPRKRPRTTSPPPSILLSTPQQLPGTSEKFGKHFAAVAAGGRGRRVVTTTTTTPLRQQQQYPKSGRVGLLPSASQQVCGSPGVEAMAEAFLRGDSHLPRQQQQRRQQQGGDGVEGVGVDVTMGATLGGDGVGGGGGEVVGQGVELGLEVEEGMEEGQREVEGGVEREQSDDGDDDEGEETYGTQEEVVLGEDLPVDEVSAVMENLDDFLGGNWDVDADLAKARAEQERESRGSGFSFAGSSGLMDIGVWD